MLPIALIDLDDTLFQTGRKCPTDVPYHELVPVAFATNGRPSSFATPRQAEFMKWLVGSATVIPVTARSRDALRRVKLHYSLAICSHGGLILDEEGLSLPEWTSHVEKTGWTYSADLSLLAERLRCAADGTGIPLLVRIESESGVPLYVTARHRDQDEIALRRALVAFQIPEGWRQYSVGNSVTILPPYLGKERAVTFLIPRLRAAHPHATIIGIGDSTGDAAFLSLCDFAMVPTRSQLGDAFRQSST